MEIFDVRKPPPGSSPYTGGGTQLHTLFRIPHDLLIFYNCVYKVIQVYVHLVISYLSKN